MKNKFLILILYSVASIIHLYSLETPCNEKIVGYINHKAEKLKITYARECDYSHKKKEKINEYIINTSNKFYEEKNINFYDEDLSIIKNIELIINGKTSNIELHTAGNRALLKDLSPKLGDYIHLIEAKLFFIGVRNLIILINIPIEKNKKYDDLYKNLIKYGYENETEGKFHNIKQFYFKKTIVKGKIPKKCEAIINICKSESKKKNHIFLLKNHNDKIIGIINSILKRKINQEYAEITEFIISKKYRSRNTNKSFMSAFIKNAKTYGVNLFLIGASDIEVNPKLYKKMGFNKTITLKNAYKLKDGSTPDYHEYYLHIHLN